MQKHIFTNFPAIKNKHFRIYLLGHFVSSTGTWIQWVTLGWLVYELTSSPFMVGLSTGIQALPVLLFTLLGGVLVDRFNKRKLLFITQVFSLILALALAFLTLLDLITVNQIIIMAFLLGVINAIDSPARQAYVAELAKKEHISSAIALNSSAFNLARVLGPSFAGIIILSLGAGAAFLINSLSFFAILIALSLIPNTPKILHPHAHPLLAIKEGLRYAFTHSLTRNLLLFVSVSTIFGWSFSSILPVIAKEIYNQGPANLGLMYSSAGVGSVLGALLASALSRRKNPLILIFTGSLIFSTSLILLSLTANYILGLFFIFLAGLGFLLQIAITNSTIQHNVEDRLRGRVMSIYILMHFGMTPLGSFQIGFMAEHFGSPLAIRVGAIILLITAILLILGKYRLKNSKLTPNPQLPTNKI